MKRVLQTFALLPTLLILDSCVARRSARQQPELDGYNSTTPAVHKQSNSALSYGNNFLLQNRQNLWELYVEGDPLERGLTIGALTDSLLKKQERIFFTKIDDWVPSKMKQRKLHSFLKWYNRKLYRNVTDEYKTEIYGISEYTSHDFDNIAPRYLRSLYLHGAHDIGHALKDLALVGCSSFAAWGDKSEDGSLVLGRNFDFYAGDDFAQDKIVAFIKPKTGYPFMMVTWPGMIGAVSGMNNEGISVTINAGKSKVPLVAKTPISLVTREILQYAKNIDEAIAIAKKRKVFVSESIMVGSAHDKRVVIIEVSPKKFGVYDVPNSNQLICSNHFQSSTFKNDKKNKYQVKNSHSQYRYDRMTQLLAESNTVNPARAAAILRNKEGLNNLPIGYGNEKALNQLLAHHAVIFKPEQRLVWVSANPYQLGEFVCYDLNKIFNDNLHKDSFVTLQQQQLNIPKDPFLGTQAYKDYEQYRLEDKKMDAFLKHKEGLDDGFIKKYQSLNPEYWGVYYKPGLYFYHRKEFAKAREQFLIARTKEITTLPKKKAIEKYLSKRKMKAQ